MPNVQFWDDKLTEEIEVIQLLLRSIQESRDNPATDDSSDLEKVFRDANRTKRCLQMETKLLPGDSALRLEHESRLKALGEQLASLEAQWRMLSRNRSATARLFAETTGCNAINQSKSRQGRTQVSFNRPNPRPSDSKENVKTLEELEKQRYKLQRMGEKADDADVETARSDAFLKRFGRLVFHRR